MLREIVFINAAGEGLRSQLSVIRAAAAVYAVSISIVGPIQPGTATNYSLS
jgi:hypothetical protein